MTSEKEEDEEEDEDAEEGRKMMTMGRSFMSFDLK